MMKKTILLTPVIAIAIVSMLFSCVDSEKDLYDPSYQTSNPMGDGFAAPDGFNWATTSNVKVNVEVNAQTDDEFYYVVEIYDTNPIISPNAHLLDKGVAKGNEPYTSEISIESTIKTIFVKEITPTGLATIRTADYRWNCQLQFQNNYTFCAESCCYDSRFYHNNRPQSR